MALKQAIGDRSPGSMTFSVDSAQATEVFHCLPADLQDEILTLIGTTFPNGNGGLDRSLPRHHMQFPHLYCTQVQVVGMGTKDHEEGIIGELVDSEDGGLDTQPATSQYFRYAKYQLTATFAQRPYAVLGNDAITSTNTTYYNLDNTEVSIVCPEEWLRYVDISYSPAVDFGYAQHGQLAYMTGSGDPPGSNTNTHFTFSGFPRIPVPKSEVSLTWYQIPDSYLLSRNSYLASYVGRVNQLEWFGWFPGELLYLGVKVVRRYTQPFPDKKMIAGGAAFDHSKLLDLQIILEETVRENDDVPDYGAATNTTIANRSYVTAGHNLQPWLGGAAVGSNTNAVRGFYYAGTRDTLRTPVYDSFNMALLFRDPDV